MGALHKFEGRDVIGTKIAITGAGDGLSQAMAIDPEELSLGDSVYVVIETTVGKIAYERVKDTDVLNRVQTLRAGTATIVDFSLVGEVLDAQRLKIEQARGIERLDFDGGDDDDDDL